MSFISAAFSVKMRLERPAELVGAKPLHLLTQTALPLKSPTGAFIATQTRIFQNCLFTGRVVEENGSCRACFLRKQPRSGQLARPLRHGLRRATLPLLSLRDIFPRSGGSLSSKGEALAKPETLPLCQGLSLWESWQARQGLTERARTLHGRVYLLFFLFHCSRRTHARRER